MTKLNKLRIGVDARALEWPRTGVARVVTNVLREWAITAPQHEYYVFLRRHWPPDDFLQQPCFVREIADWPRWLDRQLLWEHTLLPLRGRQIALDAFWGCAYSLPLILPARRNVLALWDVSFSTHPGWFSWRQRIVQDKLSRIAARRADRIITASSFDRDEIVRAYGVPASKVDVVNMAPETKFRPATETDMAMLRAVRTKYGMPERFILHLAQIFNRRNVDSIIEGFNRLHLTHPDVGLLVAGANRTLPFLDFAEMVRDPRLHGKARYIEFLPEEDIVPIYQTASVFVYTTEYEGDAIPIKEAMACGTPVVTSPMLGKAVGEAAQFVQNPRDADEVCAAFARLLDESVLAQRQRDTALLRVHEYTWAKVAQQILATLVD